MLTITKVLKKADEYIFNVTGDKMKYRKKKINKTKNKKRNIMNHLNVPENNNKTKQQLTF